MAAQAVQFLIHVQLLQPHHQLLLGTAGIDRVRQIGQAGRQLGALAFTDQRNQRGDLGGDALDAVHALLDRGGQLVAFTLARGHEAIQGGIQQGQGLGMQGGRIHCLALHHARHLQQFGEAHLQAGEAGGQPGGQLTELAQQRIVDHQGTGDVRRTQAHDQIDLAAAAARSDALAQLRLQRTQFFGQAHADLQEPVVDRAQLTGQRAPAGGALAVGIGGHASNHAGFRCSQSANGTLAVSLEPPRPPVSGPGVAPHPPSYRNLSMTDSRPSGRQADQLREVRIERAFTRHAEGSVLVSFGETRVLCTASVENRVPGFLRGKGEGWVTAEYGMLPRSTHTRNDREAARGKQGGRTLEIQRLIGRTLRACIDRGALGERTITLDCDVLQADGGTRTAAITGAYVALVDAVNFLIKRGDIKRNPIFGAVAAVSVGVYRGTPVLDLDYAEDSDCDTDMNVVMNDGGGFIELQGTAEGHAFRRDELDALLALAEKGIKDLFAAQQAALAQA